MKQCKALFKKEWNTHGKAFLIPLWATGAVYAIALIGWIISLIRGQGITSMMQMQGMPAGYEALTLYGTTVGVTALLGVVAMITAAILADSVINGGFKRRCEILHFSQPVSFLKIIGSKFLLISLAMIIFFGLLSLVNAVVVTLLGRLQLSAGFQYGMLGWLQTFVAMSVTILFICSLAWFFAGLFKHKSFLMGLLVLLGIEVAIAVLNYTAGWHIPSLFAYLGELLTLQVEFDPETASAQTPSIDQIINLGWDSILSGKTVVKLALSAVFTALGAWLYKNRELC